MRSPWMRLWRNELLENRHRDANSLYNTSHPVAIWKASSAASFRPPFPYGVLTSLSQRKIRPEGWNQSTRKVFPKSHERPRNELHADIQHLHCTLGQLTVAHRGNWNVESEREQEATQKGHRHKSNTKSQFTLREMALPLCNLCGHVGPCSWWITPRPPPFSVIETGEKNDDLWNAAALESVLVWFLILQPPNLWMMFRIPGTWLRPTSVSFCVRRGTLKN